MRTGRWRRTAARCAPLNAHVRPPGSAGVGGAGDSFTCAPGAVPTSVQARSFHVSSGTLRSSSKPKRGAVGCSWMTKNQPGSVASPRAAASVRSKPRNVMSGSIRPRKSGSFSSVPSGVERLRLERVDQRVGVAVQELAADQQDDVRLPRAEGLAERGRRDPRADRRQLRHRRRRAARVPEAWKNVRAHVARELAPEQLRGELVVQSDHVRLDEARVVVSSVTVSSVDRRRRPGAGSSGERSRSGSYIGCGNVGREEDGCRPARRRRHRRRPRPRRARRSARAPSPAARASRRASP